MIIKTIEGNKAVEWETVSGVDWDKLSEGSRSIITDKFNHTYLVKKLGNRDLFCPYCTEEERDPSRADSQMLSTGLCVYHQVFHGNNQ